jgi:hypothetical protein
VNKGLLRFRQLLFAFPHDAVIRVYDEAGNAWAAHLEARWLVDDFS